MQSRDLSGASPPGVSPFFAEFLPLLYIDAELLQNFVKGRTHIKDSLVETCIDTTIIIITLNNRPQFFCLQNAKIGSMTTE